MSRIGRAAAANPPHEIFLKHLSGTLRVPVDFPRLKPGAFVWFGRLFGPSPFHLGPLIMTMAMTLDAAALTTLERGRARGGVLSRLAKLALMALGGLLVLLGVLIAPLPGPFGLPIAVVGLMLILRNSYWAKRRFIQLQRARPNWVMPFRRLMRRNPEFAPVFWQQLLRIERLLLGKGQRVLARWRRRSRTVMRAGASVG